jgi:putative endonuclease
MGFVNQQGLSAEACARQFLEASGLSTISSNYRCKFGEIDLIMRASDILVIVEVRLRRPSRFGSAAASVSSAKQRRIIKTTQYFLQQFPLYAAYRCRFDIVAYDDNSAVGIDPTWIRGAFSVD